MNGFEQYEEALKKAQEKAKFAMVVSEQLQAL